MNNSKLILSPYVQEINRGDKYIFINPNIPRWIVTDELGKLILSLFNGENTYGEIISIAVEGLGDTQKDKIASFCNPLFSHSMTTNV